jgi:hypothetical protein
MHSPLFIFETEVKAMVNRITITLEQPEYSGLLNMAVDELRNPQDQMRWLLRCELARQKLLLASCSKPRLTNTGTDYEVYHNEQVAA